MAIFYARVTYRVSFCIQIEFKFDDLMLIVIFEAKLPNIGHMEVHVRHQLWFEIDLRQSDCCKIRHRVKTKPIKIHNFFLCLLIFEYLIYFIIIDFERFASLRFSNFLYSLFCSFYIYTYGLDNLLILRYQIPLI